jgi:proliferating cell nuclear antigen
MEDSSDIDFNKYRMYFKTIQSNSIKTLVEGLKDLIKDVHLYFNDEGIQIITVDGQLVAIIHVKLIASRFEVFHCKSPISIAINIKSLHTLLRTISNNDVIAMYIDRDNETKLHIVIENAEKNFRDISSLKLLDINDSRYVIPNMEFDFVIKMPSSDFQRMCKDLGNIADTVVIKNEDDKFIMEVDGDIGSKRIVIGEKTENGIKFKKNSEHNVSGEFDLRYLQLFNKNANLCASIEIFLKKDNPLIIIFNVASLGSLKFALAPKTPSTD